MGQNLPVHEYGDVVYSAGAVIGDVEWEDAICCDIQSNLNRVYVLSAKYCAEGSVAR